MIIKRQTCRCAICFALEQHVQCEYRSYWRFFGFCSSAHGTLQIENVSRREQALHLHRKFTNQRLRAI